MALQLYDIWGELTSRGINSKKSSDARLGMPDVSMTEMGLAFKAKHCRFRMSFSIRRTIQVRSEA